MKLNDYLNLPEGEVKIHRVPSKSRPGEYYEVEERAGKFFCGCIAGKMNRQCSHVKILLYQIYGLPND